MVHNIRCIEMKTILSCIAIGLLTVGPVVADEAGEVQLQGFDSLQAIELGQLDDFRGRENVTTITDTTVTSQQSLESSITGSLFSAGEIQSGKIYIGDHAYDNFHGISSAAFVTGVGNSVTTSVGVNIYIDGDLTQ